MDAAATPPILESSTAKPYTGGKAAMLVSLLALVLIIALAASLYIPSLRTFSPVVPTTTTAIVVPATDEKIAELAKRLDTLQSDLATRPVTEAVTPVEPSAEMVERLAQLEARVQSTDTRISSQGIQLKQSARLPVALALMRVEERFERGQNFNDALALLQRLLPAPLGADDTKILTDAAGGVTPTAELVAQVDQNERILRRADRLANVSSPLDRIWAELQSLVLIKTDTVKTDDVIGQTLSSLKTALARDNPTAFMTAWNALPPAGAIRLADWKREADRRLAAHRVLQNLIEATLNTEAGTAGE